MIDDAQAIIYRLRFELAFRDKKGVEFQDWFARLAGYAFGSDFEAVRAYGSRGDLKCDGRRLSTGTIFQCYAPDAMKADHLVRKIDEDFHGAFDNWPGMAEWAFVHNDKRGLPADVLQHIDSLRAAHPSVKIVIWSEPQLSALAELLDLPAKEALFGPAPSRTGIETLIMDDLPPVINHLQREDPSPDEVSLKPPSPDKLEKNELSAEASALLTLGRRKEALVDSYFRNHPRPDMGEEIAESFRRTYASLRDQGRSPDQIFAYLQQYAGSGREPKRQGAALAVLSYFFERCDIFEDPETDS